MGCLVGMPGIDGLKAGDPVNAEQMQRCSASVFIRSPSSGCSSCCSSCKART